MDCLHCVGDHHQEGLLEGGQPGLLVGDEQLEEDGLVEDGQLGGIPVFFCELQPSSNTEQEFKKFGTFKIFPKQRPQYRYSL